LVKGKRFALCLFLIIVALLFLYWGANSIWLLQRWKETYNSIHIDQYFIFSNVFTILLGIILGIPFFLKKYHQQGKWEIKWIKLLAIGVPTLLLGLILPRDVLIPHYHGEYIQLFRNNNPFGAIFGFVLITSLTKESHHVHSVNQDTSDMNDVCTATNYESNEIALCKNAPFGTGNTPMNFQYVEIDEESLQILRDKNLYEPIGNKKVELHKWAVDPKRRIALLDIGWVSSCIARTDDRTSYWYFLLMVNGIDSRIQFAREGMSINAEKYPVQPLEIGISSGFAIRCGFSDEELKLAVCEAIRVLENGQQQDYKDRRKQEELKRKKLTPVQIMHGELSLKLQQYVNGVHEIDNMEHLFRTICLKHFIEYNVAVQRYSAFYVHGDSDSYFIFDVILWMYLHVEKTATIENFTKEYPLIANEKNQYKSDYEQYFCIGGAIEFLTDHYLPDRIKGGEIILEEDIVRFSEQHAGVIIHRLKNNYKDYSIPPGIL